MKSHPWPLAAVLILQLAAACVSGQAEEVRSGRMVRGTGTNATYHSFVIPLDLQQGLVCSNIGGVANSLYQWNATGGTLYHYNATNLSSATNLGLRIPFINPIASFGSRAGGSPLYLGQQYRFGVYSGHVPPYYLDSIKLYTFSVTSSNWALVNNVDIPLPNPADTNEWSAYLTNGYTRTVENDGLTTIVNFDQTYEQWGTEFQGAITLTHIALPAASNYVFQVELIGYTDKGDMVKSGTGQYAWCRMYTLEFESRPPWRAVFIDQPHFDGEPLPPSYQGKTTEELLTNSPPVSTAFSLPNAPNTYTNLDHSPELRRHPLLDQFVNDMRRDPVALARYVQNEVELTDGVSYNDNGTLSEVSVNPPGVARGALATFQEGQGGPAEQCALLVYLLRQAGTPAVYLYPPHNQLKMLDTRLSRLLRIQFKGAVNQLGQTYTTNRVIPVNYPWVAAYVGTNWIHLFPWLKDTSIEEGFNLYDYTGTSYRNGFQWVKDYLYGATNILSLATGDDTAGVLFPRFIQNSLAINAPGLSLDDMGVRFVNRRRSYARWQDFPAPLVAPTNGVALDSLSSTAITNIFPAMTNIFDLFQVEVRSVANTNKVVTSGFVRMVDVHNRRFLIRHEKTGADTHNLILSLAPFRPGATGLTNFTFGDPLLNGQYKSVALNSTDDQLTVGLAQLRHRMLPINYGTNPPSPYITYPGIFARISIGEERNLRKGDLAAVCINAGRVSRAMLNVHAEELWNMERTLQQDPSATNSISPDLYQGGIAYLTGMAYYENISRTEQGLQRLHKSQIISHYAHGLSKLSAKRVSGALPNQGDIILTQPNVDMSFQHSAIAFNGSIHSESGDEQFTSLLSFRALWMAHGSAEEHQILNSFYKNSDSVSTVRLLQLAQSRATPSIPGIFALNSLNYTQLGNSNINGTLLKNYDAGLWTQVTNWLNRFDARANQVFMTPGSVTNNSNSYKGLGALLWSPGGEVSAVISVNLNGGFGPIQPDATYSVGNLPNYSLGIDPQGNFYFESTSPGASSRVLAPDQFAGYNYGDIINNANANYFDYSPFQNAQTVNVLDLLGLSSQPNFYQNYSQSVQATEGDSGWLGFLTDGLSQRLSGVSDPVHAVTGEFYVHATDLTLPGPMPLSINRNYSSLNLANNQFGYGWKLNYMPYLSVNSDASVIYAAEPDGAVLAYEKTATNANVYLPTTAKNPQLNNNSSAGIGSVANRLRSRIEKQVSGPNTFYYLYPPSGGKRTFTVLAFTGSVNRTRPYLTRWEDSRGNFFDFEYGTDATRPDYAEVRRIQSSNGSYLGFIYDVYGHIIEAYTGDGRRLNYEYDRSGDLVRVTLPDSSQIRYEYAQSTQTVTNGAVVTTNIVSSHLVLKELKPDGRTLQNAYDQHRRVTNQWATVGADLTLVRNASFAYTNNFSLDNSFTNTITGFTTIRDVFNNTSRYDYTNGLITKITDPLNQTVIQDWYEASETNKVGYYPRSLESRTDERGLVTAFRYDANGNLTNTVATGDLLGDGTTRSATNTISYTANHLPELATDPVGNKVQTLYHSQYSFLPEYVIRLSGSTAISSNKMVYESVTNTFSFGGVTYTNMALGVLQQEIRAVGSSDAATTQWIRDGRGFITQSIRYTGTSDPAVTNTYFYNDRGQMMEETDAAGRRTTFDYDGLGRPIAREVFEAGQGVPLAWDYSYYNENGELTWSDGPRFDPEDYVWRDYDGAGRIITEVRWRSQAKFDGTGMEAPAGDELFATSFREYDAFGNLTKIIDPRGATTVNIWDALGRLVQRRSYDIDGTTLLSTEGFAYEPGGEIARHTNALGGATETLYTSRGQPEFRRNADGSTESWRYYADGRVQQEIQRNGAYWESTYDDAARTSTRIYRASSGTALATNLTELDRRGNVFRRVDAAGFAFTNFFDGLDRLKRTAGPMITFDPPPGAPPTPGDPAPPIQQAITNYYDAAGVVVTNVNALGEKRIAYSDALGRVTRSEVRDAANQVVNETDTAYAFNHHGAAITQGSGATSIETFSFTDNTGRDALTWQALSENEVAYTIRYYDLAANLALEAHVSNDDGTVVSEWAKFYEYDGLNRLVSRNERDDAITTLAYDGMGNLTNRVNPGGVKWVGKYNTAGQLIEEKNRGTTGTTNRLVTYAYYATNEVFAGLLQTRTDQRGVGCAYVYDDWLRPATNTHTGSLDEYNITTSWRYDARGLITTITEKFASPSTGPETQILRSYDPYGLLYGEGVTVGGLTHSGATHSWDSAGRRNGLGFGSFGYGFGWRADGMLASTKAGYGVATAAGSYGYTTAGLLTTRTLGNRTTSITSRDGAGRPLGITTTIQGTNTLVETLSWTGEGLLTAHTLVRPDFTDERTYAYADLSRRLTEERLRLDSGKLWTNSFVFDSGAAGGAGVLTRAGQPLASGITWKGGTDSFQRVNNETNNVARRPAYGTVNGLAAVRVYLDSKPMPVTVTGTNALEWRTTLEMTPGSHQLVAYADHPSGIFTTNKSVTVTNNASDRLEVSYSTDGQITNRVWKKSNGSVDRTQALVWDARGRLSKVTERDANTNGFNWSAVYDGLGRRLRTTTVLVTNSVAITSQPKEIRQYYDPLVEFMELGVSYDGRTAWKLYGPDLNGVYGGMNGTGGFDAFVPGPELFCPILSDARGNLHAVYDQAHAQLVWYACRPTGYGAVPEYRPVPLANGAGIDAASAWRGRWSDITGLTWLGARYYDPVGGRFFSADPLGHGSDPSLYAFANGDPINYFDPDGRLGKATGNFVTDFANSTMGLLSDAYYSVGYAGVYPFSPDTAEAWYGQSARSLANSVVGTAQTTYDLAAWTTYAAMEPFAPDFAYNAYGGSMARVDQMLPELYGGSDQSLTYQVTYGTLSAASMFLPTRVGNAGRTPALLAGEGMVGAYDDLIRTGSRGDNLTPHHMPSAAYMESRGVSYGEGIAMNMEQPSPGTGGRHRMTSSYGAQPDLSLTPRQALAGEVKDVRSIYMQQNLYTPEIRQSLQQVIQQNLATYPGLFERNAPVLNIPH